MPTAFEVMTVWHDLFIDKLSDVFRYINLLWLAKCPQILLLCG
jgi:hypothetical protein